MSSLPDISSMKLSELKKELNLYGIDSSTFVEKQDMTSALKDARKNLPRPSTSYREVEAKKEKPRSSNRPSGKTSSSSGKTSSSSRPSSSHSSSSAAAPAPAAIPQPKNDAKKILAMRSPVTALQILRENPSLKVLGKRDHSFLPGSPFSFALKGSIRDDDSAIIKIPDGVCLKINAASVERKPMENFLLQKGSIGTSLRISTEENPQLMPIWTFDKEKSKSYTVSDLGIQICGPRKIRLLAFMEMGFRSGASVDVFVFGSVGLDKDKF